MSTCSFTSLSIVFYHLDLPSYLDNNTNIALGSASSHTLEIVSPHIRNNFICKADSVPQFNVYSGIKKLKVCKQLSVSEEIIAQYTSQSNNSDMEDEVAKVNVNDLPPTLTHLYFALPFNKPLDHHLPLSLKHLILSVNFDQPLNHLPPKLTHLSLELCSSYSHPLNNLPSSLTHIWLPPHYTQLNSLPLGVTHLYIGAFFNQPFIKLPPRLILLKFGSAFNQPLIDLPESLTTLCFGNDFNQPLPESLPPNLTRIKFGKCFNSPVNLPPSVIHIEFGAHFNLPLNNLPPKLKYIKFGTNFDQKVENLPPTLTHLVLGVKFDQPLQDLPLQLKHLEFQHGHYNKPIHNLPPNLNCIFIRWAAHSLAHMLQHKFPHLQIITNSFPLSF